MVLRSFFADDQLKTGLLCVFSLRIGNIPPEMIDISLFIASVFRVLSFVAIEEIVL